MNAYIQVRQTVLLVSTAIAVVAVVVVIVLLILLLWHRRVTTGLCRCRATGAAMVVLNWASLQHSEGRQHEIGASGAAQVKLLLMLLLLLLQLLLQMVQRCDRLVIVIVLMQLIEGMLVMVWGLL